MSLDDPRNPFHAAALERGEDPEKPSAKFRLATLLAEHDDLHSIHHHMLTAGRVLAFLPRINAWFDAEQQPQPGKQLRQQQTATLSDEDFFLEQAHYHLRGYREAMAVLVAMKSAYADAYDPDAVRQDREDDRARAARQDEHAVENAPEVKAS